MKKLIVLPLVTTWVFASAGREAAAHVDPQGRPHTHAATAEHVRPEIALALASGVVGVALALATLRAARRRAVACA